MNLTGRSLPVEEFLWGLGAGGIALALAAAVAVRTGRLRPSGPVPVTGVVMTGAALWTINRSWAVTPAVVVGLAGVAGAAAASGLPGWRPSPLTAAAVAAPFAWLLAIDASSTGWVRTVVVGSASIGSVAASRTDAGWSATRVVPALYVVTAAGVFAAVPDTEEAAVLLGAAVPPALAAWPLGRARLGPGGAGAAAALLVWVAAVGGRGRQPSIVGAVACLGLLATLPAGRWLARRWTGRPDRAVAHPVTLLVTHMAVVAVASRVAGVSDHMWVAVPVAAVAVVAALAASTWLGRSPPSPLPPCGRGGSVPTA
jgi:hypothetical protein